MMSTLTGEEDLVQDMNLLRKTYAESMVRFKILNQAEADLIFGKLYPIIPLHNSLACALSSLRDLNTGLSKPLGKVVLHWVASLHDSYVDYCGNLIRTKAFIDYRRETDKGQYIMSSTIIYSKLVSSICLCHAVFVLTSSRYSVIFPKYSHGRSLT